jgi:hypothetical protein
MAQLSWNERVLKLQKVSNVASSLVALLSCLPPTLLCKWLSCAEMNELLTYGNMSLGLDCLRASCTQATKLGHLETRKFLSTNTTFYRFKTIQSSSTLQDERDADWVLPQLPSSYFVSKIFCHYVNVVNDFVSFNKTIATRKRKSFSEVEVTCTSTPAGKKSKSTGTKATTVTPSPKSKVASQQPRCRGWTAEKLYDLFELSFRDCSQCTGMDVETPDEIGLSAIYKNFKEFPNLAFFCEESGDNDSIRRYVLRSRQCTFSANVTGLCVSCGPLIYKGKRQKR